MTGSNGASMTGVQKSAWAELLEKLKRLGSQKEISLSAVEFDPEEWSIFLQEVCNLWDSCTYDFPGMSARNILPIIVGVECNFIHIPKKQAITLP